MSLISCRRGRHIPRLGTWLCGYLLLLAPLPLLGQQTYFAQASAGSNNGTSCANARAVSTLASGDWGAGKGVHLCGTITSSVSVGASGASGNVTSLIFETGAKISRSACGSGGCIAVGGNSFVLIDGSPTATACGYVSGANVACNGIIEATNNGTGLGNTESIGIYLRSATNVEVRNLWIRNMYVHSSTSDNTMSGNNYAIWSGASGNHYNVHNLTISNVYGGYVDECPSSDITFANSEVYDANWGMFVSGAGTPGCITTVTAHDNNFHDWTNWDTTTDTYHHDGIIMASNDTADGTVTGINIYNNYFHGPMSSPTCSGGNPCLTAHIFMEGVSSFNIFNNLLVANTGEFSGNGWIFTWSPVTPLDSGNAIMNNTIIGSNLSNGGCISVEGDASMRVENNIASGCAYLMWAYANDTFTVLDHNVYQGSTLQWRKASSFFSSLAAWRTATSAEVNSQATTGSLNLSGSFVPNAGSLALGAGANLTSLGITALNSDKAGSGRPSSGAWDSGAYQGSTTSFTLTTSTSGAGSGSVSGMNCASGTYASGTLVGACTATPSAGSTFTGWTGTGSASGCTGTGTCGPFTLSANSTINAAFSLTAHTLSTATAGTGSGTITGCAGSYVLGDPYTCLANPAAGSTVSWSSTCGGTPSGLTYSGAMPNSACTVTGTFQGTVATPTYSPVAGSYSTPQRVAITSITPGTVIHYTVDGSTPTTSSPVYTHKLYVAQSQTLKALAAATGYTNSAVGSSAYVVSKAKTRFSLTPTSSSSIPVPYPPDLRACCGSNVAALETARGTYNLTSFHNWISAALAHSSTFTYTIQGFPAWMTGLGGVESAPPTDLHVTAACQNVLTGTTTTDCSMKEFVTKLMMDRTGLSSQPANPVTCANLDYLEIINEFNTDDTGGSTGWTGTYADLAVLGNDISERAHLWCSNTVVVAGSASAIVGFHTNGENAHYDVALETLLADWTGIANASLPDAISFHAYPSRNNIVEMPMPTTIVSHSSSTCTSGNTPNTSCYKAVKDEVNQLNTSATLQNAAIIAWAKNLPIYSTEGGFGEVSQLGGTSTTTIGAGYVAQSMMAIAAQNPVNHMFYAADDPTWGCYWNCGSGNSAWLFAYNQMLSWLNANSITGTLTSTAITGGNKWSLQLNSGAAEIDFCDAWLASCTASTSFNSVQTLSGVTTSTGGSVTLTQEPSLLFNAGIVATPTFSPVAGSYGSTQNVTISDSTAGATICYTTDGSTPTSSPVGTCSHGTTYSTPVSVSSSLTLKAIGTQAGNADSPVGSAAYVIAAATPTFSPVAGAYGASQSVTISDTTPSSTIYYTTDGSTPTTGSTVYSTPITVSSTTTVKAIAAASGFGNSAVGSALYSINGAAATPTFLPVAGTYSATQAVVISSSTAGATICWTSDGSTPTANGSGTCTHGTTYSGAVTVASSLTLKAVASKATFVDSSAGSAAYVITAPSPVTVTLTGTQKFSGTGSIQ